MGRGKFERMGNRNSLDGSNTTNRYRRVVQVIAAA
jgi:hypothetical protein